MSIQKEEVNFKIIPPLKSSYFWSTQPDISDVCFLLKYQAKGKVSRHPKGPLISPAVRSVTKTDTDW